VILAGDEASLYLQATLMRVWHATGQTPVVKISPQRHATHFYGALNLLNGQETVMRAPVMNTQTSALFLQQLLTTYPKVPLLLLWDRATWHRGLGVQTILAANPRLEILFLPQVRQTSIRKNMFGRLPVKPLVTIMSHPNLTRSPLILRNICSTRPLLLLC